MPTPLLDNRQLGADVQRPNLLVNGGFEIWQRGNGPFTTDNTFTADRWRISLAGGSVNVSRANAASGTNGGVSFGLQAVYTYVSGASIIIQSLPTSEFQGLKGQTLSLSMRVACSAANAARLSIGTDGTGASTVYSAHAPGGNTWTTLTATISVPFDATVVSLGCWMEASATYIIDNAMLVVGSQPADFVPLHPQEDLARCQRYYEAIQTEAMIPLWMVMGTSTTQIMGPFTSFTVRKAVAPTITFNAGFTVQIGGGAGIGLTTLWSGSTIDGFRFTATAASGITSGTMYQCYPTSAPTLGSVVIEANP